MATQINAKIIADSICNGHRITTMLVIYPRSIHSEMCRHRMQSRNTASSRAIPTKKMIEMIQNDPFIPIAWQEQHTGMQGTKYITDPERIQLEVDDWISDRDYAIRKAIGRMNRGITKQIINRPLEAWAWTTELITATEWENFYHLRCPKYFYEPEGKYFRSRKDWRAYFATCFGDDSERALSLTELDWLKLNKGQAEIHMMALAEAMWDARNESTPKVLQPGEWHIPYMDKLQFSARPEFVEALRPVVETLMSEVMGIKTGIPMEVPLATALCAQTSYTVIGDDGKPAGGDVLMDIHGSLLVRPYTNRKGVVFGVDDPKHMTPAEHCAQAMTKEEIFEHHRGDKFYGVVLNDEEDEFLLETHLSMPQDDRLGWCHNLCGWKSYRSMIPNENRR